MKIKTKLRRLIATAVSVMVLLSSITVSAAEEPKEQVSAHTLTVNVEGTGTVDVDGEDMQRISEHEYRVLEQTEVTIKATPNEGMQLETQQLDGVDVSETFTMPSADAELEVVFTEKPESETVKKKSSATEENQAVPEEADKAEMKKIKGIDLNSYSLAATTRASGTPTVGSKVTGTCYIGSGWTVNYPYQDYFYVSNFSGDLANWSETIQNFECLDPTAALPYYTWASYVATVETINMVSGYIIYYVYITPPGATTGVPDGSGHLTGYQHIGGKIKVPWEFNGSIELRKSSANPELTEGNSCYSLAGAVYGVYNSSGKKIAELKTNESGYAKVNNIPAGSYRIKEITAPKGFAVDVTSHRVTVTAGKTATLKVTDLPQNDPIAILLGKIDRETTKNMPQGSASLKGAEFTVKYYFGLYDSDPADQGQEAVRTWVFSTDEDGYTYFGEEYKVSGDEFYYDSTGYETLPIGTITVQETKAPEGYKLNDEIFVRKIVADGTGEGVETYNAPLIPEDVIRGDLEIVKFGEVQGEHTGKQTPLEGVIFEITSKTTGETVEIVTDENGYASTQQLGNPRGGLAYDTYTVHEKNPPAGYHRVDDFEITISEEGQELFYILEDELILSPVKLVKTDSTTGKTVPLADAEFQLLDENKEPLSLTALGETQNTFKTDSTGTFTLPVLLPAGTYYFRELQAPEGYLLSDQDIQFVITDGYDWDSDPIVVAYENTPGMGQIEIIKTESGTEDPLKGAEFRITAAEDIVTPDGTVRAAAGEVVDTVTSGDDGVARSKELYLGKYTVTEIKQPTGHVLPEQSWEVELAYKDQYTKLVTETLEVENQPTVVMIDKKVTGSDLRLEGVKFELWKKGNDSTKEIYVTDETGKIRLEKLEPGTYCIQEIEGVPGYAIDTAVHEFTITEDGRINGQAEGTVTIENAETEITETNVINTDTGDQNAYPQQITAIDTVSLINLQPGTEYVLTAVIADALTGLPVKEENPLIGDEIAFSQTFTATDPKMDVDQEIAFDASLFAGRTLVVYEYLYQDGVLISEHADPQDVRQQLYIRNPKLHTTAIDVMTGTHEAIAKDNVTIRDNVDYYDILPGTYTLRGVVMDQETGDPLLLDDEPILTEKEVEITEETGTISMDFALNASGLNNKSIVIFEYLYQEDELITSHEDIQDENQTIVFKVGSLTVDLPGNPGHGLIKTGDVTNLIPYGIAVVLAGSIITVIAIRKRKGAKESEE